MIQRKVANPAPAVLAIVNPTGGKKTMSTKRKTSGGARRRRPVARATNAAPKRRRRRAVARAGNPSPRRRFSARRSTRQRNPSTAITSGLELGAASALVEAVSAMVPNVGGNTLLASAGRTAATGLLLGKVAEQFAATRKYSNSLKVAGIAIGAAKVVSYFATPYIKRAIASATGAAGLQGIGLMPGSQLPVQAPARPVAAAPAGVNGIGLMPFRP